MCHEGLVINAVFSIVHEVLPDRQKGYPQIVLLCMMHAQTKLRTWCPIRVSNSCHALIGKLGRGYIGGVSCFFRGGLAMNAVFSIVHEISPDRQKGDTQTVLLCMMHAQTKLGTWCPIRVWNSLFFAVHVRADDGGGFLNE